MATGLVYHPDYVNHIPFRGNPEVPERISGTYSYFRETGLLDQLTLLNPEPASSDDILRVHTPEHADYIHTLSETGYDENTVLNTDVYVSPRTCDTAYLAAGGLIKALESVWTGKVGNCFALVRPPGHHAQRGLPAGFCYFNNAAVAIEHMREVHGVKRVAVFDWDAHAGHGTMEVFYTDPDVLTVSVHQDPRTFYPGTGFVEQVGDGWGTGCCVNIPVPAGTGDPDYIHILDDFVLDYIREFGPELLVVAAGQDSHATDTISGLRLTDDGYAEMTAKLMGLADGVCDGKLVLELEGGYNLQTLPQTHHRIVSTLLGGEAPAAEGEVLDSTKAVLEEVRDVLA